MKIYQVVERGGRWKDPYRKVIASYMDKQEAINDLEECLDRLRKNKALFDKCTMCQFESFYTSDYDDVIDFIENGSCECENSAFNIIVDEEDGSYKVFCQSDDIWCEEVIDYTIEEYFVE